MYPILHSQTLSSLLSFAFNGQSLAFTFMFYVNTHLFYMEIANILLAGLNPSMHSQTAISRFNLEFTSEAVQLIWHVATFWLESRTEINPILHSHFLEVVFIWEFLSIVSQFG